MSKPFDPRVPCYRQACAGLPPHPSHKNAMPKKMSMNPRMTAYRRRHRHHHYRTMSSKSTKSYSLPKERVVSSISNISSTLSKQSRLQLIQALLSSTQSPKEPLEMDTVLVNPSESIRSQSECRSSGLTQPSIQQRTRAIF